MPVGPERQVVVRVHRDVYTVLAEACQPERGHGWRGCATGTLTARRAGRLT